MLLWCSMKVLKTIVMWLLLAAIPLQGLAANVMVICQASHQRSIQLTVPHHGSKDDKNPLHRDHHEHQHRAAAADTPLHGEDTVADSTLSKCSGCAASCAATTWLTVERITLPAVAGASDFISYTPFPILGVILDPPEHPPRFALS
jgi:hypothetical protein